MWILEKNFPKKVLYVESLRGNTRLEFGRVESLLENGDYSAISSHLIAPPVQPQANFKPLVIAFLRDPAKRLISAYEFQKATNTLKDGDVNFRAFLTRLRNSPVSNYQTRLISPQSWDKNGSRNGWDINPRAIDLDYENIFVGTVEMFDQSLVLLEEWLQVKGIKFDASYYLPNNTGSQQGVKNSSISPNMIFPDMIELDQYLWQEVTDRLTKLASSDYQFEKKMREFASRRESVSSLKISIAGPDDFVRL
jgi:Sulfotransferase family